MLDETRRKDIKTGKDPNRSLDLWLDIINPYLPPNIRLNNNRALSAIFKFFNFERGRTQTTSEGGFRRIVLYEYKGGFKNEKME